MSRLIILQFPNPILAKKASPIARVEKSLHKLADDMLETMYDAPGIGLAANQVGILQRILVLDTEYQVSESDEELMGGEVVSGNLIARRNPKIIVNPEIIKKEGSITLCEGCLSVPEYTSEVKRFEKIQIRYQDIDGLTKTLDAEGLMAVCIQHEMDHLDGKLFIDRLSSLKRDMAKKMLLKSQPKSDESDE